MLNLHWRAIALACSSLAYLPCLAEDANPAPTPKERYEAIKSAYGAANDLWHREKAAPGCEQTAPFPDPHAYCRQFLAVAEAAPGDPAACDSLIWVLQMGIRSIDDREDEIGRAVDLLIRDHADVPEVARTALLLVNHSSPQRDRLFRSLPDRARDRVARGTAIFGLAQYLAMKVKTYALRRERFHAVIPRLGTVSAREGIAKMLEKEAAESSTLNAEAVALYRRVIDEYGDVPYVAGDRFVPPDPGRTRTLGQVAEGRLDEMLNLVAGRPAPEIEGLDVDGKPRKLSDYLGKVVVLNFWNTGCGPCMQRVPHERKMVERLKGRPFAMLGVNSGDTLENARTTIDRKQMTWPNWFDGETGDGPIVLRYQIRGYPESYVLDAQGIIRYRNLIGKDLDLAVDGLLKEAGL